jgi:hypothetical protein
MFSFGHLNQKIYLNKKIINNQFQIHLKLLMNNNIKTF